MSRGHLVVVLAPNGLGHPRRALGIVARLLERELPLAVTVVGAPWQRRAASAWRGARTFGDAVTWVDDVTEPGVAWGDPGQYDDGRLIQWEDRLATVPDLGTADVVLSDNLVGVLSHRPDTVLAGSFLWSDVLEARAPTHPEIRRFVDHERLLLDAHRPSMLCVRDLAMPGVLDRTNPVTLGWMCGSATEVQTDGDAVEGAVAVLGGATGAADDLLGWAAGHLASAGVPVVTGIPGISNTTEFGGPDAPWAGVSLVVCRPGAGTLTDAVARRIPSICLYEDHNIELGHNARRVEALGIGRDLGSCRDRDVLGRTVDALRAGPAREEALRALASLDRTGLDGAAEWLAVHFGATLGPRPGTHTENIQGDPL